MHLKKIAPVWIIFLLGLLLRLSLMFIDFSFDVNNHIVWAQDAWNRGLTDYYMTRSSEMFGTAYPNYPPLAIGLFTLMYAVYKGVFGIAWYLNITLPIFPSTIIPILEERYVLAGFMKIPGIVADLGLAWVLIQIAIRIYPKKKYLKELVASLILFHPTFFYNSAFWGQVDSIPLFFTALGFYLLLFLKRPYMSMISMTAAILIKPTALVFFPIFILVYFHFFGWKKSLKLLGLGVILFWIAFVPFSQGDNPFFVYKNSILDTQSLGWVSNAAYSAWVLNPALFLVPAESPFIGNVTYQMIGTIIAGMMMLTIIYFMWKAKDKKVVICFALGLVAFSSFLFLTKMHERYMILILPFLLIPALQYRSIFYTWILVSAVSFLNLYKSWSLPRIDILAESLSAKPVVVTFALINLLTFLYILAYFISLTASKKKT